MRAYFVAATLVVTVSSLLAEGCSTRAQTRSAGGYVYEEPESSRYTPGTVPPGDVGAMTVLKPGDSIEAQNRFGYFKVVAITDTKRSVTVKRVGEDEKRYVMDLWKRKAPYHGLTGIYIGRYYAPDGSPALMQEGLLFMATMEDVRRRLNREPSMDYVVTEDGLAIGLFDPRYSPTVDINIFQIVVDQKPIKWAQPREGIKLTRAVRSGN